MKINFVSTIVVLALMVGTFLPSILFASSQVYPLPVVYLQRETGSQGTTAIGQYFDFSSTTLNVRSYHNASGASNNYKAQLQALLNDSVYHNNGTIFQFSYSALSITGNCELGYTWLNEANAVTFLPVNAGTGFVNVTGTSSGVVSYVVTSTTTRKGFGIAVRPSQSASPYGCSGTIVFPYAVVNQGFGTTSLFAIIDPLAGVSSNVSVSAGGSSGTTTVVTPNDDLINFGITFFIFLGIMALFSYYGSMVYFKKS